MSAWLQKTPKGAHVTNAERYAAELPAIRDDSGHLPEMLEEMGMVTQTGMSVTPLGWQEIQAWSSQTMTPINSRECKALRMMSAAFAGVFNSSDENCPIDDSATQESIDMVNIRAMIAMAEK